MMSTAPHFDGDTFDPARDGERLFRSLAAIRQIMADGKWRTLKLIALRANCPEASASARLRDLRKAKFGGHKIERRHIGDGLHEYRMVRP